MAELRTTPMPSRSLVAIPIFPLRYFTAGICTRGPVVPTSRRARSVDGRLASTTGRRAAPSGTGTAAALGPPTTKVRWIVGGPDGPATVRLPEPPLSHVAAAPAGKALSDLLLAGEWHIEDVEEAARVLGTDYHARGLARNRHAVATSCAKLRTTTGSPGGE